MAENKKRQTMRYSDPELALIKRLFSDNDFLLVAVRKHFYQQKLSEAEKKALLSSFPKGSDSMRVLRKTILPELDGDAPFNQVVDLWSAVPLKERLGEDALTWLSVYETLIAYLGQQFDSLEGGGEGAIRLSKLIPAKAKTKASVPNLIARNMILGHVDSHVWQLSVLAGQKGETVEETVERLRRDSAK